MFSKTNFLINLFLHIHKISTYDKIRKTFYEEVNFMLKNFDTEHVGTKIVHVLKDIH